MDRFLGRYSKRIDAKGRVSIPAPFRAILARDGTEGMFALRSLTHPAVEAGGQALIGEIDALLSTYEPFSQEYESLSIALLGGGDTLAIDGEGRIVMPDWVRQASGIADEVIFVGLGSKFQLWSPERYGEIEAKARIDAAGIIRARAARTPTAGAT